MSDGSVYFGQSAVDFGAVLTATCLSTALASILTYHVLSGKVIASDIIRGNGAKPTTVNGQMLDITLRGGKVYVNGVQVITADVQASNGVIHVIDAVLLPKPAPMAAASPTSSGSTIARSISPASPVASTTSTGPT